MKPNLKSARDAIGSGIAVAIYGSLTEYGVLPLTAGIIALGIAFLIPRAYRALRKKYTWLNDFDPAVPAPDPPTPLFP